MCNLKWYVALAMVLWAMVQPVKAEVPDLNGANVVSQGVCVISGMPAPCIEVEKAGKRYVVIAPAPQVIFIYEVKEGAVQPYTPDEMRQIYPPERKPDHKEVRTWPPS